MKRAFLLILATGVFFSVLASVTAQVDANDESGESAPSGYENQEPAEEGTTEQQQFEDNAENDDETYEEDVEGIEEETEDDINEVEDETSKNNGGEKTSEATTNHESKVLQTGNKNKRKTKHSGPSKKLASRILPLLMIPLMIQAQLIPMMLIKLKFLALKALMLGKAALVIVLLNLLRNSLIGADSMEEQYEQQTLASSHYGYSGMPEIGAWINRRVHTPHDPNGPYRGHPNPEGPYEEVIIKKTQFVPDDDT